MGKRVNRRCRATTTVTAVALATVFFATSLAVGPAVAGGVRPTATLVGTDAPDPPAPASCEAPPVGVSATTEDCLRFVSLWEPRIADQSWLESFIKLDAVPADIAAEGFHALDAATTGWLASALANQAGITDTQTQAMLSLVIFGKDQLNQLRDDFNETTPSAAPAVLVTAGSARRSPRRSARWPARQRVAAAPTGSPPARPTVSSR